MRRGLGRWRELTGGQRWMLVEATFALGGAFLAIALLPFRTVAARAGRRVGAAPAAETDRARQVATVRWAITACARRLPWRTKCFEQGLAAQWMLGRRRIPATLHYGVAKESGQRLVAHVWLRSGSLDVVGCENSSEFVELARFP